MKSRNSRRRGRQLPEWMAFTVVLSLSVTIGMPIAARLRDNSPQSSEILWFFAGIGIGFLVLFALCFLIGAATWLLVLAWQKIAREK